MHLSTCTKIPSQKIFIVQINLIKFQWQWYLYQWAYKLLFISSLVIYRATQHTFRPQPSKLFPKKLYYIFSKKCFRIFWKMELFGLKIKFSDISSKIVFPLFWETKLFSLKIQKILILSDLSPQNFSLKKFLVLFP